MYAPTPEAMAAAAGMPKLPLYLLDALRELEADETLCAALGKDPRAHECAAAELSPVVMLLSSAVSSTRRCVALGRPAAKSLSESCTSQVHAQRVTRAFAALPCKDNSAAHARVRGWGLRRR